MPLRTDSLVMIQSVCSVCVSKYAAYFRVWCKTLWAISRSRFPLCLFSPCAINQPRQFVMASLLDPPCPALAIQEHIITAIPFHCNPQLPWNGWLVVSIFPHKIPEMHPLIQSTFSPLSFCVQFLLLIVRIWQSVCTVLICL